MAPQQSSSLYALIGLQTVPAGVELTPAIEPFEYKPINISLNIDWKGDETLSGFIRVCSPSTVAFEHLLTEISVSSEVWRACSTQQLTVSTQSPYTGCNMFT